MKKKFIAVLVAASVVSFGFGAATHVQAFSLGSILKIGGIGIVVDKFGGQIDSFLNKLMKQNNMSTTYATKVVPIVSIGSGGFIGAAQVTGPKGEIDKVEAVAQLEGTFNSTIRVKGMVPIDSKNPVNASRVQGVGVSALIDVRF